MFLSLRANEWRGFLATLLAGVWAAGSSSSNASDHLDTPTVMADPRADIGDIYAWTSPDGRHLNLVMLANDCGGRTPNYDAVMPTGGVWLLNVIWSKPLPSTRKTDFETTFASLSFGFGSPPGTPAPVGESTKVLDRRTGG
jgi:hypothetical protein